MVINKGRRSSSSGASAVAVHHFLIGSVHDIPHFYDIDGEPRVEGSGRQCCNIWDVGHIFGKRPGDQVDELGGIHSWWWNGQDGLWGWNKGICVGTGTGVLVGVNGAVVYMAAVGGGASLSMAHCISWRQVTASGVFGVGHEGPATI